MQELQAAIKKICQELFGIDIEPELTRPEPQFGDYSTNVAMRLAKKLNKNPREIAEQIKNSFHHESILSAEVAEPGFINFTLTNKALVSLIDGATALPKNLSGQEIIVEFGDPNPFKEMHIGHAYSYITGDAIASLLSAAGARVHRLSYHGDVGLHVAKAICGMQKEGVDPEKVTDIIKFNIGIYYAKGAKAYDTDKQAKSEIDQINGHIYRQDDPEVNRLYKWGRQRSLAHFDLTLKDLNIEGTEQYFESEAADVGVRLVREYEDKVFKKSNGAIVFEGEKAGLHTRVFITSAGLPTYETKDLGLASLKAKNYPKADRSIIITAHEQVEYFKVMLAALAEIDKRLSDKTQHLYHGFVSLSSGKMSSRTGDVYSAVSFIVDVDQAVEKQFGSKSDSIRNAAIKYGFLKHRLGSDIVYDVAESISLEGNSGPYLQYAHARARSILKKSSIQPAQQIPDLEQSERILASKISEYPEVIEKATAELTPHHICTYLYELAQTFNSFYEKNRVVGNPREAIRLQLVTSYAQVLKEGLKLLNIAAPEQL